MKKLLRFSIPALIVATLSFSCKKDEPKLPTLTFKTGAGYTTADIIVAPGTTITVGVVCDQGDDSLNLIYSEVAYDGANVDSLYSQYWVPDGQTHAEHDFTFQARTTQGSERWTFNVNDNDGRLVEKEIRVLVQ